VKASQMTDRDFSAFSPEMAWKTQARPAATGAAFEEVPIPLASISSTMGLGVFAEKGDEDLLEGGGRGQFVAGFEQALVEATGKPTRA
jgi:hypothetical protein